MGAALQPHAPDAATLCVTGCRPVHLTAQVFRARHALGRHRRLGARGLTSNPNPNPHPNPNPNPNPKPKPKPKPNPNQVHEAMTDLVKLLATLVDCSGKITIAGIEDQVAPLAPGELENVESLDFDEDAYKVNTNPDPDH